MDGREILQATVRDITARKLIEANIIRNKQTEAAPKTKLFCQYQSDKQYHSQVCQLFNLLSDHSSQ